MVTRNAKTFSLRDKEPGDVLLAKRIINSAKKQGESPLSPLQALFSIRFIG